MKCPIIRIVLSLFMLAVFACPLTASADKADALKPLLVNIDGFEAEDAEGAALDMGGMKMINAVRSYSAADGEKTINAMIIVGTNAMVEGQMAEVSYESEDGSVTVTEVDGLKAAQTHSNEDKEGAIVVDMAKTATEGAIFAFNYYGIEKNKALELAKKFNWKKIKAETEKLLK